VWLRETSDKNKTTLNHVLNLHLHVPKEGSKCLPVWCSSVLVSSGHWWQTEADLPYIRTLKYLLWSARIFQGGDVSLIGSSVQYISFKLLIGEGHAW